MSNNLLKDKKKTPFVTPTNDLSKYNYTRSWDQGLKEKVYGYDVSVPDMPPEKDIINNGRPIAEQIFRRTLIPKDLHLWPENEQDEFISREHHRRVHGLWFFIKGKPIYIPGLFYFFMNYWVGETKKPLAFRIGDWKFFMIWMHTVLTPWIHGLIVFKCRRIGDTEKALCMLYEYASRVKDTVNHMYDCRTEKDVKANFGRLKKAHRGLVWFMKPVIPGLDNPAQALEFRYPSRKSNAQSYIDGNGEIQDFEFDQIDSEINYQTNSSGPDGKRIGRGHVDEFGKANQIDPLELWDLGKKSIEDDFTEEIVGKFLFTSTIEDMGAGKALEISKKLWELSNPDEVFNGQTTSGLIRVVRGALDRAMTDRWGFVNEEEILEAIKAKQKDLIEKRQWKALIIHKRQNCVTIQDVFSNISEGSPFNLDNISNRLNELLYADKQTWVRGKLKWKDNNKPIAGDPNNTNRLCEVEFQPHPNGNWFKAFDPEDFGLKKNAKSRISLKPKPGNVNYFACGIDPVSYTANLEDGEKSLAGLSIKRLLDHTVDKPESNYDAEGKPIDGGRWFKTNRYVMFYVDRHMSPSDNYNDWLMSLVYFGTDFRIEKNHSGGFMQYLETYNFMAYYEQGGTGMKNAKGKEELFGQTASNKVIEAYFGALTELTNDWCNTIDIPRGLEELSTMEERTKTKHDLGVSMGFCELHAHNKIKKISDKHRYENEQEEVFEWSEEETY